MLVKTKIVFLFLSFLLAVIIFTTCDSPMGMGDPIDWEPPVLKLDPKPPTPMYVGLGAQLTGTVTDNDVVVRVILRDSSNGKQLAAATLLPNNRWEINLDFYNVDQNGETILADVVAYDRRGNSGSESIASVVLFIDIRPPIVEDIWIQRTSTKTTDIEKYTVLKELELSDPHGELNANVNRYQNGAFHVRAKISEKETRVKTVLLKFYDSEYPNIELFSLQPDSGSSLYNPQWLVTEDMILDAGNLKLPDSNYKSNYKNNDTRYYYRLRILAYDSNGNESEENGEGFKIIEDMGYICLWQKADLPKGFLDPIVVGGGTDIVVTKGSSLPVIFFDDDKIEWAYAALFTKEQWLGQTNLADDFTLSQTDTDIQKFEALKNRLRAGKTVYNWRYDSVRAKSDPETEPVVNLIPNPVDDKIYYIITGNEPTDYGEFIFVSIVKDLKQSPHNTADNTNYPDVINYRKYNVNLVDENAPLIVFDKANGSPEENTFPSLDLDGNFRIHGYTLREDKTGESLNYVKKFGLAWIPFNISNIYGGPEENITVVKKALAENFTGFPAGVQWWNLWDYADGSSSGTDSEVIANTNFKKQSFTKTFSILGEKDDLKPEYENFTRIKGDKDTFENTTKLFVFYAEDNMGHIVYTQFYLLGNRTPPEISIYDITDKLTMTSPPVPDVYDYSTDGDITPEYIEKREIFNKANYLNLKSVSSSLQDTDKTETYRAYPRRTILKFWANAKTTGDIAVKDIKMEDVTFEIKPPETQYPKLGYYEDKDFSLGYVEYFPEVSQRVFLFTATDMLGNEAKVQRTIAIASAATLTSITTTEQNGTYPAGKVIDIKANFDSMIKLQSNTPSTKPKLNVLYRINTAYVVEQIPCEDVDLTNGQLSLIFKFNVPTNGQGRLETIYTGIPNNPGILDRPITLTPGNNIIDAVRGDIAYTPGNVIGFFWNKPTNSLQYDSTDNKNGKNIFLDGVVPTITDFKIIDTKAPYTSSPNEYYFKSGESLSFEITASKPLKVTGDASLSFRLLQPDNTTYIGPITGSFEYRKVTGNKIVFTLDVNKANISNQDHGRLSTITIYNAGNITDDAGNKIDASTLTPSLTAFNNVNTIRFDLSPPPIPGSKLTPSGGGGVGVDLTAASKPIINYNKAPYLGMDTYNTATEPYGIDKRQYSLNGGLRWVNWADPDLEWNTTATLGSPDPTGNLYIPNGQWTVKTRYIDRAGNEGAATEQLIYVNSAFPKLIGVNVKQPNATYKAGDKLEFTLDFDDVVTAEAGQTITIALKDTVVSTDTAGGANPTYQSANIPPSLVTNSSTLTFTWNLSSNTKDMLTGLMLASLNITGLKDRFGNFGPAISVNNTNVTVTVSADPPVTYSVPYNLSGIKVSTITPTIRSREPQNANNRSADITQYSTVTNDQPELVSSTTVAAGSISADNKTIKLNFSKPMQKGNGTITIKPRGNYAIPAVFENDGYYLNVNLTTGAETTSPTQIANSTYISGFYDIFNTSGVTDANKTTLIGGTSMSTLNLDQTKGLSPGPYLKTTHGLKQGAGYTGNYGNPATQPAATIDFPGNNAPGPRGTDRMVPDVTTKWVLDYQYIDLFATSGVVNNIRTVLNNVKWRWQEIAVSSTNVNVGGNSVTITLPEPLLPGLQWEVSYPAGTFTDAAGNAATAGATYWFWSKGVQKPVIRVDRKSYDARISANYNRSSYEGTPVISYNADGYNGTIASFNTIAYRITSETPQARIFHGSLKGAANTGSATGEWTGTVSGSYTWQGPKNNGTETIGYWVRPNLIFRNGTRTTNTDGKYITMFEPSVSQTLSYGTAIFYGLRSYNRDATFNDVNGINVQSTNDFAAGPITTSFNYTDYEASKNYVAAEARIDHTHTNETYTAAEAVSSQRGFEGVFRTVVMIHQNGNTGNGYTGASTSPTSHPMMISGSTARNSLPTVSGFPLKDGTHRTDSRYVKFFHVIQNSKQFYWVTSEMVSQWYFQLIGNGNAAGNRTSSAMGDVDDWITAGYGDLTYTFDLNAE